METRSYAEFSRRLHAQTAGQRLPITGTIEITRRCPLACAHCYNNLPMGDQEARRGEMSYENHCRLLDEITEAGCLWLLYTGGEIFARKDFLDIYTYAKHKGLFITLFTNGTLLTPQIADYLVDWRPFAIEITLYGHTQETYERLTGIPGSYHRCLRGIRLLVERGLPLKLKTVAVTLNQHEIRDMQRFAEEELGLEFKFDAMMNPRIDCSQSPLAVRLQPQEVVALDLQEAKRVAGWRQFAAQFNGPVNPPERSTEVYHCGGGISSFAIDPCGKMSICVLSHAATYDVRQGNFREGWEHFLAQQRRKKISRLTKCTTCAIKAMCGMCPANGELENGDPESPVEFLCHVAHLRAYALDIPVPPHGPCAYCLGGDHYHETLQEAATLSQSTDAVNNRVHNDTVLFPIVYEEPKFVA
ncbi:MAG: radical SAM protein [Candidatus Tectomicrobia bacterium]|nr:radical SAM protein [Candidatus Tectomicrobia bacterium]